MSSAKPQETERCQTLALNYLCKLAGCTLNVQPANLHNIFSHFKACHVQFPPELLQRMDSLYAFYHQQWWCYRKMLNHFKCVNALFNGLALLLMAAGMIAGPLLDNSTLVACLAAVGTVVKGWNDFKQYRFKVTMSRFAFTTYAKALTELKTYVRGVPLEDLEGFLIKMQT